MISDAIRKAYARICHAIVGFSPALICVSTYAGTMKDANVKKKPMDILRKR